MKKSLRFKKPLIKKTRIKLNIFSRGSNKFYQDDALLLAVHTGSHGHPCSDKRLKKEIEPIKDALGKITRLEGKRFHWKNTKDPRGNIGFIAQEVENVVPEVVQANSVTGFYTLEYDKLTALLVEGVKQQQEQIDLLQKEIEALKTKLKR